MDIVETANRGDWFTLARAWNPEQALNALRQGEASGPSLVGGRRIGSTAYTGTFEFVTPDRAEPREKYWLVSLYPSFGGDLYAVASVGYGDLSACARPTSCECDRINRHDDDDDDDYDYDDDGYGDECDFCSYGSTYCLTHGTEHFMSNTN